MDRSPSRWRLQVAGALSAALALGIAELLASVVPRVSSVVVAVGAGVIDLAPPRFKDAAISLLGTADKPALILGIVVLTLVFGAGLARLSARSASLGTLGLIVFGALGVAAAARDPRGSAIAAVAVIAPAVAVGAVALIRLVRRALEADAERASVVEGQRASAEAEGERASVVEGERASAAAEGERASAADDTARESASRLSARTESTDRRAFLRLAVSVAAVAAVSAAGSRISFERRTVAASRAAVPLPSPAQPAAPPPEGASLDVQGISNLVTPNDDFYRIDTALATPQVDAGDWQLRVTGMVDNPLALTYDELLAMPQVERYVTIACVSNEVGGNLIGNALWTGVPLRELLERAGVQQGATQIVGRSTDGFGFTAGFPTEAAFDGREALVAVGMNGEPLPPAHGYPARLVVAGLYGYVSATKWLREIELTTWEGFDGYWVPKGWAKEAPIKTQSRIDVPGRRQRSALTAGPQAIAGVAWAPNVGIVKVEVRIDRGLWAEARLAESLAKDTWRQWVYEWDAPPGEHELQVRATDSTGYTQTEERAAPAPDGATGYHTVQVSVS
ncbi:MAG TPA: sulfite oxidase [Egibacteraceae bacterium]|nr:sulfite oxidase [Egibacteraceae bacterium]